MVKYHVKEMVELENLRNSELIYGKVKEIIDNKAVVLYAPDWAI